jgi:hypothetical protein
MHDLESSRASVSSRSFHFLLPKMPERGLKLEAYLPLLGTCQSCKVC